MDGELDAGGRVRGSDAPFISGTVTPTAGQTHLVYAPVFHGCHSVLMQACKYAALRQAWTVTLDRVIQRLLDHVRNSLSLSLQISGEYQSFKSDLGRGAKHLRIIPACLLH